MPHRTARVRTPPNRASPGACHTLKTDSGHDRCPFPYPNPTATMRTFQSERRLLRYRHLGDPMTDNPDSEFRTIQHWHYQNVGAQMKQPPWPAECTIHTATFH